MSATPLRHLPAILALLVSAVAFGHSYRQQPAQPAEATFSAAQGDEIGRIVRAYLLKNPEVIREVIDALQAKEKSATASQQATALREKKDQLLADPGSPTAGNPVGDVTIVEFFDYRCPYCKKVAPALAQLLAEDKGLKLIYKEFPILSETSVLAARAALAARFQDRYSVFHDALMAHRGDYSMEILAEIARTSGLDPEKLIIDMNDEAVSRQIADTHALAEALSVTSTPTFIIGDKVVPGAIPVEEMRKMIVEFRNRS